MSSFFNEESQRESRLITRLMMHSKGDGGQVLEDCCPNLEEIV